MAAFKDKTSLAWYLPTVPFFGSGTRDRLGAEQGQYIIHSLYRISHQGHTQSHFKRSFQSTSDDEGVQTLRLEILMRGMSEMEI